MKERKSERESEAERERERERKRERERERDLSILSANSFLLTAMNSPFRILKA